MNIHILSCSWQLAEFHFLYKYGKESYFKWLWMRHGRWSQTGSIWVFEKLDRQAFSHTTVFSAYSQWSVKEKKSIIRQFYRRQCSSWKKSEENDPDRFELWTAQISSLYNGGILKSISEGSTRETLKQMAHSRWLHRVSLPLDKNGKLRLKFGKDPKTWTIEDRKKNVALSGASWCLQRHLNSRTP